MKTYTKREVVELMRSINNVEYFDLDLDCSIEQVIKVNNLESLGHVNGQWYWSEDKDVLLKYNNGQGAIGFVEGAFSYDWGFRKGNTIYAIPATEGEVLKSFKGEAIKRGLVKGCRFINIIGSERIITSDLGDYIFRHGYLYLDGYDIFNGKEWATPIKQEKLTLEERITAIENKL